MRPGMYIGKVGDGKDSDDGIYVLLKEVIDNSVDEYTMGNGKSIEVGIRNGEVRVRDYGRGIPLGKVVDCVSKINTGGKYDSRAFKKTVGLNGVGTKAVNALSSSFQVDSFREGESKTATFALGELQEDRDLESTTKRNGTKAHLGIVFGICVEKGSELPKGHRDRKCKRSLRVPRYPSGRWVSGIILL